MKKLSLSILDHPRSYKLSWLRKGGKIQVSRNCLTKISIEKKKKKKWCDVILMDACHHLLRRPWQYDLQTIHDGYINT